MLVNGPFTYQKERETTQQNRLQTQHNLQKHHQLELLDKPLQACNKFSYFGIWVSKSLRTLFFKSTLSNGFPLNKSNFNGMVVNNSVFVSSPSELIEEDKAMVTEEGLVQKNENVNGTFRDLIEEEKGRESSSSSDFFVLSETAVIEEHSRSSSEESASPPHWSIDKKEAPPDCNSVGCIENGEAKPHLEDRNLEKQASKASEIEMMKERFSKLLLGEDMSGCGNGVCTALAISNAITNLCATLFGQLWRLEPLSPQKKAMWRREIEWLLCVSDHIVQMIPSWQTFPDGSKLEVMTCRPRSDLYVNLPALRKLDNMLLEILDSFQNTEFWYVDEGILAQDADGSTSFRRAFQRQEEKWWLPVPRVPSVGLHENTRKQLQQKRDSTNQILKAAMVINSLTLAEMEVPDSYLEALPKNGRASLGDLIYRYISSDQFNPECLFDCLDLSSEHHALEIANRVEASIYVWRKRANSKPISNTSRANSKSSWGIVKDLMIDGEKRELLADRAESLLLCLKQRFPGLPQSTLDMSKIQCNKDVGKSILESYSRVLESLAFNIVARIDDLLYVDDLMKHSDLYSPLPISTIGQKSVAMSYPVPFLSTPYRTAFGTPNFSPAHLISPLKGDRSPFTVPQRGVGVKKVLTDYLSIDTKGKNSGCSIAKLDSVSTSIHELSIVESEKDPQESEKESLPLESEKDPLESEKESLPLHESVLSDENRDLVV